MTILRSLSITLLILSILFVTINSKENKMKEKKNNIKPNNKCLILAKNWLIEMPFLDNEQISAKESTLSWNEWINKGKSIEKLEKNLLWLLGNEDNDIIKSRSAISLGFTGSKSALNPLINSLESSTAIVQMEAAAALGRLGDKEAVDALCKAMENEDANVRANVCIALDKIDGDKARECLKKALSDSDPFVKRVLEEILNK